MKIGIMQPYFFPYIGYWQLINAVDKYVVYDDVSYIKSGWINRNNFLINKQAHLITLPLKDASSFKKINEIKIDNDRKNKVLKTFQMAYSKAPYYKEIMSILEELILKYSNIAELNYYSIIKVCEYLDIETEILLSSALEKNNNLKAQEKVIHINKVLNSTHYINAIGGQDLYDKEVFKQNNITLNFLKTQPIKYKQFNNDFVSNLSIIDILMFCSKKEIKDMLNNYELL